jgi:signal transduction histidine kinase
MPLPQRHGEVLEDWVVIKRLNIRAVDASHDAGQPASGDSGTGLGWEWRGGREPLLLVPGLRRVTGPASVVVLAAATVGAGLDLAGRRPAVVAASAAALLVVAACVGWLLMDRPQTGRGVVVALTAASLAGIVLVKLLPGSSGFAIICLALAGLGIRLPSVPALVTALCIFTVTNLTVLLTAEVSVPVLISQNTAAAFLFAIGVLGRSALIAQQASHRAQTHAEDLLARLSDSQAAQAAAAALAERARVAREIHDILAHALSGLVLTLDTMELLARQGDADLPVIARLLEQVTRAQRIARDGLADTRQAIAALRGGDLPGPALLKRLVDDTAAAAGLRATFTVIGEARPLSPETGLTLYRTAQEALINTAKYVGRGGRADLRLSYFDDHVELTAQDAQPAGATRSPAGLTFGGYGLTGMRERAELLGGELTAGPADGGFLVVLLLPAKPTPGQAAGP